MNIFTASLYPNLQPQHYVPFSSLGMNNDNELKRKRCKFESDDLMDGSVTVNDGESARKRTKFIERLNNLHIQQPNQITISLRGTNQPIYNSHASDMTNHFLNDYNVQYQEYIRRKEYQHELEQFQKNYQEPWIEGDASEVMDREDLSKKYDRINSLLHNLHVERSMRSPSKQF